MECQPRVQCKSLRQLHSSILLEVQVHIDVHIHSIVCRWKSQWHASTSISHALLYMDTVNNTIFDDRGGLISPPSGTGNKHRSLMTQMNPLTFMSAAFWVRLLVNVLTATSVYYKPWNTHCCLGMCRPQRAQLPATTTAASYQPTREWFMHDIIPIFHI